MNNLMLSFSAADLTRLRVLVATVQKEIVLAPRANADAQTALDVAWSSLVGMLNIGPEPEMRECPKCGRQCMLGATRCGSCWSSLPTSRPIIGSA